MTSPGPSEPGPSRSTRNRYPTMPWTQGAVPVVSDVRAVAVVVGTTDVMGPPERPGQRRRGRPVGLELFPPQPVEDEQDDLPRPLQWLRVPTPARPIPRPIPKTMQAPPTPGTLRRSRATPEKGRCGLDRCRHRWP